MNRTRSLGLGGRVARTTTADDRLGNETDAENRVKNDQTRAAINSWTRMQVKAGAAVTPSPTRTISRRSARCCQRRQARGQSSTSPQIKFGGCFWAKRGASSCWRNSIMDVFKFQSLTLIFNRLTSPGHAVYEAAQYRGWLSVTDTSDQRTMRKSLISWAIWINRTTLVVRGGRRLLLDGHHAGLQEH